MSILNLFKKKTLVETVCPFCSKTTLSPHKACYCIHCGQKIEVDNPNVSDENYEDVDAVKGIYKLRQSQAPFIDDFFDEPKKNKPDKKDDIKDVHGVLESLNEKDDFENW